MKKHFRTSLRKCTAVAVALFASGVSYGQNFIPAGYAETVYPPIPPLVFPNPVDVTTHTSCYGFERGPQMSIHAWDDPGGTPGIAYRDMAAGSLTVNFEGYYTYPAGVRDLEVTLLEDPSLGGGPWYAIVAYYNTSPNMGVTGMGIGGLPLGAGHYYDLFEWTPWGVNYVSTTQLSTMANYTRISIDAHLGYAIAIAWEEPAGIYVKAWQNGSGWSNNVLLTGTAGETYPDVAFAHGPAFGTPGIHLVYHKRVRADDDMGGTGVRITESLVDWAALTNFPWPTTYAPIIEDLNFVPWPYADYRTHIDCPDHGDEDWTYTYVDPWRNKVYARVMDAPIPGTAVTYCLTDGSLGGMPPVDMQFGGTVQNDWAVVSYEQNGPEAYFGWHTMYDNWGGSGMSFGPPAGQYIGFKMDVSTATISSPLDYLIIPTGTTDASSTPALNFSKNNEDQFLFCIYAQYDGAEHMIQNKYVPWGSTSFKPSNVDEHKTHTANVTVYPVPFNDALNIKLPQTAMDKTVEISITDIKGSVLNTYEGKGSDANAFMNRAGGSLSVGTYIVTVNIPFIQHKNVFKVQKTE